MSMGSGSRAVVAALVNTQVLWVVYTVHEEGWRSVSVPERLVEGVFCDVCSAPPPHGCVHGHLVEEVSRRWTS